VDKNSIIKELKKAKIVDKQTKLIELCANKNVLDVGCVGQDLSYSNKDWLHDRIRKVSKHVDGVDINEKGINALKSRGYSVFHANELNIHNKKYDIILMSDVIEHVNDPVYFIKFYSAFITEGGCMIITTPNAHGVRNFSSILIRNDYSLNPEHTFWFCPKTLTEVVERANLKIVDFYWLYEYFSINQVQGFKNKVVFRFNSLLMRLRHHFSPNFLIIISKK
jgi:2-polyprenyl-3-methyl-5-hydroxy-6-metoxy-1,4-benzoquinol methylase